MKDWSGKNLCFECAKRLGANINIGRKRKGRCHRCHSEQIVFEVIAVPNVFTSDESVCPECAHPEGTHAASCPRSELDMLKREREEIVRVLEQFGSYRPDRPLADQLREMLHKRTEIEPDEES